MFYVWVRFLSSIHYHIIKIMLPVIDGSIQATVGIPEHRTLTRRASKQQRGRQVDFHPTGRPLAVISSVCGNNWCKNGVKRVFEGEKTSVYNVLRVYVQILPKQINRIFVMCIPRLCVSILAPIAISLCYN